MMRHHQTDEVLDAVSRHQVVFFVGARGTGKTLLVDTVEADLRRSSVEVLRLDAADIATPADVNDPLALALGCSPDEMTAATLPPETRLRIIIDNCQELHGRQWLPYLQDQLRALLSASEARGRAALLLCGRPQFRGIAGGRGSPLLNIGIIRPARSLDVEAIESIFQVPSATANAVARKTGGHPQLTASLMDAIGGELSNLERAFNSFAEDSRRYLIRLVEDHALAARPLLADLLASTEPASEAALIARHFGDSRLAGQECLDDLCGSGLVERKDGCCTIKADLLRSLRDIRSFIGAPPLRGSVEPSREHAEAAITLYRAENRLRNNVASWLEELDQAWWPSRVPSSLVAEAEQRRLAELESSVPPTEEAHPILYLTFGELVDVIATQRNWHEVFRIRWGLTRPAFEAAVNDVTAVRHKVAHNRKVTADDLSVLNSGLSRLRLGE